MSSPAGGAETASLHPPHYQLPLQMPGSAQGAPLGVIKNLILSNKDCSGAQQPSSVWAGEDPQGSFL